MVRWVLAGALAVLLAIFVVAIGFQATRLGLFQLLAGIAIVVTIGAALVAVLWYGRVLGGVTEARIAAEAAARSSEDGFRTIAATMSDGIITIDDRSRIRHVNEAARRMFAYEADELLGRELTTLMPERLRGSHLAAFHRYLETGRRTLTWEGLSLVGLRKDGREIPVEVSLGEYAAADGRIFIGVIRDMTERRRAERALAESEEKFRGLIESAPDAIFVLDAGSVVRDVNPAGEALLGRPRAALIGKTLADFMQPDRATAARAYLEARTAGQPAVPHEALFRREDGPPVEVQLTAQSVEEASGTRLVVIARDVTAQRELQRKLLETERWASMGRLASFVAHEINTPLTNISLLTASIARRVNDPEVQERLKKITVQGRFAANITAELLRFAQPGAINPVETDLRETVQAALEQAEAFRKPGVRLRAQLGDGPARCLADPARIQEVVVNLVKNAYDATASGSVTVRLEDRADSFEIAVSDTGKGIPPELRPRLFEAFFTTKKKGEGTGLGLAISRSFVAAHGGDITVSSEVGHGSTFTVILPRV
jgi:PAS domain S-box-containing protein